MANITNSEQSKQPSANNVIQVLGKAVIEAFRKKGVVATQVFHSTVKLEDLCSICLEPFNSESPVGWHVRDMSELDSEKPAHPIHLKCSAQWFLNSSKIECPTCRSNIQDIRFTYIQ